MLRIGYALVYIRHYREKLRALRAPDDGTLSLSAMMPATASVCVAVATIAAGILLPSQGGSAIVVV